MQAHGLGAVVSRPFRWTPARVRRDALAAVQTLNFGTHRLATGVTSPFRRAAALHGATGVCAVASIATSDVTYRCRAVCVEPAWITEAGVRCSTHTVDARLRALCGCTRWPCVAWLASTRVVAHTDLVAARVQKAEPSNTQLSLKQCLQ